jgi:lipopolysaccharide transport system ATP-binding protein
MPTSIKVENLSKIYRLGQIGTGTIGQDVQRWFTTKILGKEDPFLKIGQSNDRTTKGDSDVVYSLQDINFEIEQGDAVGIIGRNGAGKSTLLKILSRVTAPTTGRVQVKGRVASLLEVGTGFHPELTGRENIYLNGAILGMRKKEIIRKLDEIIDFSGVERYIDTPVKRYSSGMYVRLAFAVAAHLESEILIVDEVLAVGDAEFQKKCLGKMGDVKDKDGRTVLFVSHNMASIRELCSNAILLKNGMVDNIGTTNDIVRYYLSAPISVNPDKDSLKDVKTRRGNGEARIIDVIINNGDEFADPEKEIKINCKLKVFNELKGLYASILIKGPENSVPITGSGMQCITTDNLLPGTVIDYTITIAPNKLRTGLFPIYLWLGRPKEEHVAVDNYPYDVVDSLYHLNLISNKSTEELGYNPINPVGYFNIDTTLTINQINHVK